MGNTTQNKKLSNTRNWGSMHLEFACEFIIQSNHDHSTLEITFCSTYMEFILFTPQNKKMSKTKNWGSIHSEFGCEFKVQSNYDLLRSHPETNEPNHCHLLSTWKSNHSQVPNKRVDSISGCNVWLLALVIAKS